MGAHVDFVSRLIIQKVIFRWLRFYKCESRGMVLSLSVRVSFIAFLSWSVAFWRMWLGGGCRRRAAHFAPLVCFWSTLQGQCSLCRVGLSSFFRMVRRES
ncbi:hypothetical protein KC19_5G146700 [Ceratodon purpureus]|uniref:Transmembrane protein n=1 Tax=Ceratodon purpureus TaxID=3225 RepID=A0A8T0I1I5_CERPU|nr:hypothetical protein KC19_5G146700 [Ceratodon purpureus]